MFGMLCADLSSAIWLTLLLILNYRFLLLILLPNVEFSLGYNGSEVDWWDKIGWCGMGYISLLFGLFSLTIFYLLNTLIFKKEN